MEVGIVVFVFILVGVLLLYRREDRARRAHLESLELQNFKPRHCLIGSSHYVGFDTVSRQLAFASRKNVQLFSFIEMTEIQWTWLEKGGRKENNDLLFRLNNVASPLVKVRCTSARQAEEWQAKIQAMWFQASQEEARRVKINN